MVGLWLCTSSAWITCNFERSFAAVWFFDHLIEVEGLIRWLLLWGRVWPPIQASTTQSAVRFGFSGILLVNTAWSCRFGWTLCFLGCSIWNFCIGQLVWPSNSQPISCFVLNWVFFPSSCAEFLCESWSSCLFASIFVLLGWKFSWLMKPTLHFLSGLRHWALLGLMWFLV